MACLEQGPERMTRHRGKLLRIFELNALYAGEECKIVLLRLPMEFGQKLGGWTGVELDGHPLACKMC